MHSAPGRRGAPGVPGSGSQCRRVYSRGRQAWELTSRIVLFPRPRCSCTCRTWRTRTTTRSQRCVHACCPPRADPVRTRMRPRHTACPSPRAQVRFVVSVNDDLSTKLKSAFLAHGKKVSGRRARSRHAPAAALDKRRRGAAKHAMLPADAPLPGACRASRHAWRSLSRSCAPGAPRPTPPPPPPLQSQPRPAASPSSPQQTRGRWRRRRRRTRRRRTRPRAARAAPRSSSRRSFTAGPRTFSRA